MTKINLILVPPISPNNVHCAMNYFLADEMIVPDGNLTSY